MTERLLNSTIKRANSNRPPVWFMRQAGRYHDHYQGLRKEHGFVELCKNPELAAEVTLGPIEDFGFDAAILFSDILYPLEELGMPLDFNPGPQLGFHLREREDIKRLKRDAGVDGLSFQRHALDLIRARLPESCGLLGFVGSPLTLFYFAVEGSHKNDLTSARAGLKDGRFEEFCELLLPLLTDNMRLQADGPIDAIAMFDTCAGDLSPDDYQQIALPTMTAVLTELRRTHPNVPIVYYSKGTDARYWRTLEDLPIDCLGVDWHQDLSVVLQEFGDRYSIQGNFNPELLRDLSTAELTEQLDGYFSKVEKVDSKYRQGWVCGLGHGVLPKTPEDNVRLFLSMQKDRFG